jgi:DNA-binding GntR family transcriptional regulator
MPAGLGHGRWGKKIHSFFTAVKRLCNNPYPFHIEQGMPVNTSEESSLTQNIYNIDRAAYEPAYVQLANILRQQISEGLFRPGDRLPSEAQLCRRYEVSPMTVRRSINLLADQDVVSTAQGRGTFVKALELSAASFDLRELEALFNSGDTQIKLLDVRIVPADSDTAKKLNLALGDKTIYIRRLLTKEGKPVFYHREHLIYDPELPIVEAEMDVTSLQGLFANVDNALLKRGRLTVQATLMTDEEAGILQTPCPSAAFCLEHIFYDFDDRPISEGCFLCRADRMHFSTTVGLDR